MIFENEFYSIDEKGTLLVKKGNMRDGEFFRFPIIEFEQYLDKVKNIVIGEGVDEFRIDQVSGFHPSGYSIEIIFPNLKSIFLSPNLKKFSFKSYGESLSSVHIAEGNKDFCSVNGVLFANEDQKLKIALLPPSLKKLVVPKNLRVTTPSIYNQEYGNLTEVVSNSSTPFYFSDSVFDSGYFADLNNSKSILSLVWKVKYSDGSVVEFPLENLVKCDFDSRLGMLSVLSVYNKKLRLTSEYNGKMFYKDFSINNANIPEFVKNVDLIRWAFYCAVNKKELPHISVMQIIPFKYASLYYKDNNAKNWLSLLKSWVNVANGSKATSATLREEVDTLVRIAWTLGVFSENSLEATKFINNTLIKNYTIEQPIHVNFEFPIFDYDAEFFKFVKKYFIVDGKLVSRLKNQEVPPESEDVEMIYGDNYLSEISIDNLYMNWSNIRKACPGMTVDNRLEMSRITPERVFKIVTGQAMKFTNIDTQCLKLASICRQYGYSVNEFEAVQDLFLAGKDLPSNLFPKDKETNQLSTAVLDQSSERFIYEPLAKDDERIASLGPGADNCMWVGGAGIEALEFGELCYDAGFIVFRDLKGKEPFYAMAMVYYSKAHKTLVLDNIEVLPTYVKLFKSTPEMCDGIWKSILRFSHNLSKDLIKRGFPVERVTTGMGFNDAKYILNKNDCVDVSGHLVVPEDVESYGEFKERYEKFKDTQIREKIFVYSDAREEQKIIIGKSRKYENLQQIIQ